MELHDFYCIKCGRRGIPCLRPQSHKRSKFHRKKLYCPHCGVTVNHVECATDEEVQEFIEAFNNNEFAEELEISLKECIKRNYI